MAATATKKSALGAGSEIVWNNDDGTLAFFDENGRQFPLLGEHDHKHYVGRGRRDQAHILVTLMARACGLEAGIVLRVGRDVHYKLYTGFSGE